MFNVQFRMLLNKLYLLRNARITRLMSSKESKRKPSTADVPNVTCKKHKAAKLDTSTMAQAGGNGNSSNCSRLSTVQIGRVQESIKHKKSKSKSNTPKSSDSQHFCIVNRPPQFVVNPFFQNHPYIPYLDTRNLTTTTLNHLQLSNVSFNRGEGRTPGNDCTGDNGGEIIGKTTRKWEDTKLGTILKQKGGGTKPGVTFTFMNYNVLAQDLLDNHPEIYRLHKKQNLNWEYRWTNLLKEIKHHNSDIMCLQEVQETHYEDYYNQNFKHLGYSGIFMKRTGNEYPDGCAIFYKTDVFILIEHTSVEFNQPNSSLLNRNNVGIIAKFAPITKPSAQFIIATTHLLYNPRRNDVRLAQVQIFLTEIERFSFTKNKKSPYLPVILSGDFNSLPNSCVVEFVRNGIVDYASIPKKVKGMRANSWIPPNLGVTDDCQHIDLISSRIKNMNISRTKESELIQIRSNGKANYAQNTNNSNEHFHTGFLKHAFAFKSVYLNLIKSKMEGTTYQDQWITVDYIFYTGKKEKDSNKKQDDKLILLSRYTLPLEQYLSDVHIPNKQLGSDHLSLLAKFKLEF